VLAFAEIPSEQDAREPPAVIEMRRISVTLSVLVAALMVANASRAQTAASGKFNDAIKRSQSAAEIITKLAEASPTGISKNLLISVEAIGVFPCHKKDALIEYAVICPGAVSRRLPDGWSAPVFYKFGGGGIGRPTSALAETSAIILLFLNKQSADWLSKPFKFEDEKQARTGYLGPLTESELKNLIGNNQIMAYAIRKDDLKGVMLSGGFERVIAIDQDNHINTSLYGLKGSDILSGKEPTNKSVPPEVFSFQMALKKYFRDKELKPNSPALK
jgi:lipid-binding SYLF domain-containing protein